MAWSGPESPRQQSGTVIGLDNSAQDLEREEIYTSSSDHQLVLGSSRTSPV